MKTKLLAICALVVFFAGSTVTTTYQVGDEVANFTLKNVDGTEISVVDYAEKGAILVFDCNTCPYSKAYRDRIKNLHTKYASQGYPVLAINPNDPKKSPGDSFNEMISYAKEHGYEHPYLYDADQSIAKAFGATNTPHVFIVNKESGKMILSYIGAIDNNTRDAKAADKKYVEDAVDALMEGKQPDLTKTKAIGCTIKWAS